MTFPPFTADELDRLAATVREALIEFFLDSAHRGRADDGIFGRREEALAAVDRLLAISRQHTETVAENERLRELLDEWMLFGDLSTGGYNGTLRSRTGQATLAAARPPDTQKEGT